MEAEGSAVAGEGTSEAEREWSSEAGVCAAAESSRGSSGSASSRLGERAPSSEGVSAPGAGDGERDMAGT